MKKTFSPLDEQHMRLAIQMAEAARGQTSPNPLVGAVIVNHQQIVGIGVHLKAGEPHAEVHALRMAQQKAQGATLYVTLEPCSHYGRTPPCADQVIEAGIRKVFIATLDPNPLVAGRGVQKLRDAGLEVEVGLLQDESVQMNEVFNHYIVHKEPYVTLKTATTLDGKIATVTGESQWITGEEARSDVHRMRHEHDAILVGINTVLHDNPRLTTRLDGGTGKHPTRIIVDSTLKLPLDAQIADISDAPTWVFTSSSAPQSKLEQLEQIGVSVFRTSAENKVLFEEMLTILGEQHIASLLVEGGGEVNASFLQANLVHKLVAYIAPKLIGGNEAPSAFRGEGFTTLADAVELEHIQYVPLGKDLKVIGYVKGKERNACLQELSKS